MLPRGLGSGQGWNPAATSCLQRPPGPCLAALVTPVLGMLSHETGPQDSLERGGGLLSPRSFPCGRPEPDRACSAPLWLWDIEGLFVPSPLLSVLFYFPFSCSVRRSVSLLSAVLPTGLVESSGTSPGPVFSKRGVVRVCSVTCHHKGAGP